jgi:hypothetical protein
VSVEETKITSALRQALRNFPAAGAHEPNVSVLRVEERPTFGVGSVRMPSNQLVTIEEAGPRYEKPVQATIRFVELCRDFLIPVLEEKRVRVNDDEVTLRKPVKDENGKFKTTKQERCFGRIIPEPVLACSARLADHIESLTPETERTATTKLQSQVEGFYACTDESENTFIASAALEQPRDQVKQIVSQIEIPFDVRVPAAGLTEEEAVNLLERQTRRATQRAARGEPVIRRAIDPQTGRTVDQWGLPSFIVPPEVKAVNRERYCPPFNQSVGCSPPIQTFEPETEEEAVRLSPEEVELIAARQEAAELPELPSITLQPGVTVTTMPEQLPAIEVLSPEARRVLEESRRRPALE